jgi:hypothetical protein
MNFDGFKELLKAITSQGGNVSKVILAMESTDAIAPISFLTSQRIPTMVVDPPYSS